MARLEIESISTSSESRREARRGQQILGRWEKQERRRSSTNKKTETLLVIPKSTNLDGLLVDQREIAKFYHRLSLVTPESSRNKLGLAGWFSQEELNQQVKEQLAKITFCPQLSVFPHLIKVSAKPEETLPFSCFPVLLVSNNPTFKPPKIKAFLKGENLNLSFTSQQTQGCFIFEKTSTQNYQVFSENKTGFNLRTPDNEEFKIDLSPVATLEKTGSSQHYLALWFYRSHYPPIPFEVKLFSNTGC